MKKIKRKNMVLAFVLSIAGLAFGDTLTFQKNTTVSGSSVSTVYNSTIDSFIKQNDLDGNYGTYNTAYLRGYRSYGTLQTSIVLAYNDIQDWIDEGFQVESARIGMTLYNDASVTNTISVSSLLKEWTESGVTFASTGVSDVAWTEEGAWATTGDSPDRTDEISNFTVSADAVAGDEFWFNLDASLVQSWIDNPTENYGVLLYIEANSAANYVFHSNNSSSTSLRPVLEITGSVPEPTTMLVIMCGLGGAFLKRRK